MRIPADKILFLFFLKILMAFAQTESNHLPFFEKANSMDFVSFMEDVPIDKPIYILQGHDEDDDDLTFGTYDTVAQELFNIVKINKTSAAVYLKRPFDREAEDRHSFVLNLTDGKITVPIRQRTNIFITDVNDETPIFTKYTPVIYVKEDAKPPKDLDDIQVIDRDLEVNKYVHFSLKTNLLEVNKTFQMKTEDYMTGKGKLKLIAPLDYEAQKFYYFEIFVQDGREGPVTEKDRRNNSSVSVVVQVEDVQDTPPEFVVAPALRKIPEDIPVGTSILHFRAQDGDQGIPNPIVYSIVRVEPVTGHEFFYIDQETGDVFVNKSLDREIDPDGNGGFAFTVMAKEVSTPPISNEAYTTTNVTIIIEDVNDCTPTFSASSYFASVPENTQQNIPIQLINNEVVVIDKDMGKNAKFRVYIKNDDGAFEVTPSQAMSEATFLIKVKNNSILNFEERKSVTFKIIAVETETKEKFSSEATVTVNITDVNDHFPEFENAEYQVSIPENPIIGTIVTKVKAVDKDTGKFGIVKYTGLRGSIASLLNLNADSGEITVKVADPVTFDREQTSQFFLTIEAQDNNGINGNRATAQLWLHLLDVNDNAPQFVQEIYETTLFENKDRFERSVQIQAIDKDQVNTSNSAVRYRIIGGDEENNFSINETSGELIPKEPVDYEIMPKQKNEKRFFNLTVMAYDLGEPSLNSNTSVIIFVEDTNDNFPVFAEIFYKAEINESIKEGFEVVKVKAKDADASYYYSKVVYRIVKGADDKFIIDSDTGAITVAPNAILDHERKKRYELQVIALDGGLGSDQNNGTAFVEINILDVNNKSPSFKPFKTQVWIPEDAPVGTPVSENITAEDPDEDPKLVYSIILVEEAQKEGGAVVSRKDYDYQSLFGINNNGIVFVKKILDREQLERVKLVLQVQDMSAVENKPQTATATLTINIEDVNDNDPVFRFPPADRDHYYRSVYENSPKGSPILTVVATDVDKNRTISYIIDGKNQPQHELFSIDKNSGEIIVKNNIDREQYEWINFTVQATDNGIPSRSSLANIFIFVIDVNDNNPTFKEFEKTLKVSEDIKNGTIISHVKASDPDTGAYGTVTYLLDKESGRGKFDVNSVSGDIYITGDLDRENTPFYSLIVSAKDDYRDGYNPDSRSSAIQISVVILDINDNAPEIKEDPQCLKLQETEKKGKQVYEVKAVDKDDPKSPNAQIEFFISNDTNFGNGSDLFAIHKNTGIVRVAKDLLGLYGDYYVTVIAKDKGQPPLYSNATFRICVDDYNDNAPEFTFPPSNVTLPLAEYAPVGSSFIKVESTDKDIGINAEVGYKLLKDSHGDWEAFSIRDTTGIISLAKPLNRERQKAYLLLVEATDHGNPPLSTILKVSIKIVVNDSRPIFMKYEQSLNVLENSSKNKVLGKVFEAVFYDDEAENPQICYYIAGGNNDNLFRLNKHTRELILLKELDREEKPQQTLVILASSNCLHDFTGSLDFNPSNKSMLLLTVDVDDINDNPPVFTHKEYTAGVDTSAIYNSVIPVDLNVTDKDVGENAINQFYLLGKIKIKLAPDSPQFEDNHHGLAPFRVDEKSGKVHVNVAFKQTMAGYFDFWVIVNDTLGHNDTAKVSIYLLRDSQRVRMTVRRSPEEVRTLQNNFRLEIGNITGGIVNIDEIQYNKDNNKLTDIFFHTVTSEGEIMDPNIVVRLMDDNYASLGTLFTEMSVLEVVKKVITPKPSNETLMLRAWLIGVAIGLSVLLVLIFSIWCTQRRWYRRKLKAATAMAFGSHDSELNRIEVPGTNLHSYEGSNPMWLQQSYENEWSKQDDAISHSGINSLDENVVDHGHPPYEEQMKRADFFNEDFEHRKSCAVILEAAIDEHEKGRNELNGYINSIYDPLSEKEPQVILKLETTEL